VQERLGSAELAHAIRSNAGDASYDQVIADYMLRVGRELADRNASGSPVAQQLGDMLSAVGEDAIRSLLELGSDLPSRRQLVLEMLRVLPARSVVTLTHAAADASKEVISHALLRLFSKLAANADSHAGNASAASDSVLRDAIQQLVSGWTLDDPNPERYRHLLRFLTSSARVSDATTSVDRWVDSLRVVDIALEAGAIGPSVSRSVDELLEYGRLEELIESIDLAPSSEVAAKIREQIITPDRVKAIFSTQQSRHALDRVLEWTGIEAAEVMLDALEVADSRAMRRQLIARLTSLEGDIGPLVSERLERGPWYVQRNMLYLLSEIGRIPADFLPQVWLEHPDVRVRREAIKVALRVQGWRTQAITVGLADDDTRILNLVVGAAIEHSHASLAHPLIRMLEGPATDTGLRSLAIRALALTHSVDARDWLISRVFSRLRWWRRPALAVKSPEMLAALCALRDQWATTPRAAHALRIALRAPDAEIRAVALTGTLDT
jgi:hypothetical protein